MTAVSTALDVTDFFCGMGGSSTGLVEAGWTVRAAANHSRIAVATHEANHPATFHLCADLQAVDLRILPRTRALWASPICTEVSPAGGRRLKGHPLDLFEEAGPVAGGDFERTRVTFWEVVRAAELQRYDAVMVENVVEAAGWVLFDLWLAAMTTLGYDHQPDRLGERRPCGAGREPAGAAVAGPAVHRVRASGDPSTEPGVGGTPDSAAPGPSE